MLLNQVLLPWYSGVDIEVTVLSNLQIAYF
jgi:hypothetical protein